LVVQKQRLVLIGMMGSGKTTVGRRLAQATGWAYLDNDSLLQAATGLSARSLADLGEAELRSAESAALADGLRASAPCIVGTAAGTIIDVGNRRAMADAGTVVWLRARPATLARRVGGSHHRPWLDGDALDWLVETDRERRPLYASIADVIVDVDQRDPAAVAAEILMKLQGAAGTASS
jgi:shikimate kinase